MSTKEKRIKRVFSSSDQVIHIWANQAQSDARCRNAFFEGTKVYSYGKHYLLGELLKHKGQTVALINSDGYSVTTNQHISSAWNSVEHMPRLRINSSDWTVIKALKAQKAAIESNMQAHFKKLKFYSGDKSWTSKYNDLRDSINEFNTTCSKLKEARFKIRVTAKYIKEYNAHIQKRLEREAELQSPEHMAKRAIANKKRAANAINAWRNGGQLTKEVRNLSPQIIRIKTHSYNGQIQHVVETSRGANAPLTDAQALLAAIDNGKVKPGTSIGSFKFDSVDGDIVTIGCHKIELSEARSILNNSVLKLVVNQ